MCDSSKHSLTVNAGLGEQAFAGVDHIGDGRVRPDDFMNTMRKLHLELSDREIRKLWHQVCDHMFYLFVNRVFASSYSNVYKGGGGTPSHPPPPTGAGPGPWSRGKSPMLSWAQSQAQSWPGPRPSVGSPGLRPLLQGP